MSFAEEMELISFLLQATGIIILIFICLSRLKRIEDNTAKISEDFDYIINRLEQSAANNTLNEIEEELSALREKLNDTRR